MTDALRGVRDASLGRDIVSLKFVKDLAIDGGRVSFTIETATPGRSAAKDTLASQAGAADGRADAERHQSSAAPGEYAGNAAYEKAYAAAQEAYQAEEG